MISWWGRQSQAESVWQASRLMYDMQYSYMYIYLVIYVASVVIYIADFFSISGAFMAGHKTPRNDVEEVLRDFLKTHQSTR